MLVHACVAALIIEKTLRAMHGLLITNRFASPAEKKICELIEVNETVVVLVAMVVQQSQLSLFHARVPPYKQLAHFLIIEFAITILVEFRKLAPQFALSLGTDRHLGKACCKIKKRHTAEPC